MRITAEPRSDQWNGDDFIGGPRTFTIAGVKAGTAEQKYDIELVEGDGRVWRPPLTILRLMLDAWGDEASAWAGQRVTLFRDASVTFGPDAVGGIRVSHMTGLPGGKTHRVALTVKRGRKSVYTVEPLVDKPTDEPRDVEGCADVDTLRSWWSTANAATKKQIEARVAELTPKSSESIAQGETFEDDHTADIAAMNAEADV